MDGLLIIDKPAGLTSHDVVDRVRRIAGLRAVGHAGTLDPPATGVLVLLLGKATRLAEYAEAQAKEYEAVFRFGVETDTFDAAGTVTTESAVPPLTTEGVAAAAAALTGAILQVPPAISAVRVGGRRSWRLAREGEAVEPPARNVIVHAFDLFRLDPPRASFRIRCTKGTYVRALARDLGRALGCGGIVETLRRTRSGTFTVADAVPLDGLDRAKLEAALRPPAEAAADLPALKLSDEAVLKIRQGKKLAPDEAPDAAELAVGTEVRLHGPGGELVGIGEVAGEGREVRPRKVL